MMLVIRLSIIMKFDCTGVIEKGRSSLSFEDVNQLLEVKDSGGFMSMMASISCLMTIAICDSTVEVSRLIDFVRDLRLVGYRVAKTQLLVMVPYLDHSLLQNRTINFNVMIMEHGAGRGENTNIYKIL